MFETSASKVSVPGFSDFTFPPPHETQNLNDFVFRKADIGGKFDFRVDPELRFSLRRLHMDVHPSFFPREEECPVRALPEYGRTHSGHAPNGWRVSGERRAEGDEQVRCTRVLGGGIM